MNRMLKACLMLLVCSFLSVLLTGCGSNPPVSPLTPEVENAISLARTANSLNVRDQILSNAVSKAKTIADVQALARTANSLNVRDQILADGVSLARSSQDFIDLARTANSLNVRDQILTRGAPACTSVDEVITLARTANSLNVRDQILVSRTDLARSVEDFQKLARTANSLNVRDQILNQGAQKLAVNLNALDPDGAILARKDNAAAISGNQDLQKAFEAMQKAQQAYTDAVSRAGSQEKVLELNKQLQAAKKAYEALGGL